MAGFANLGAERGPEGGIVSARRDERALGSPRMANVYWVLRQGASAPGLHIGLLRTRLDRVVPGRPQPWPVVLVAPAVPTRWWGFLAGPGGHAQPPARRSSRSYSAAPNRRAYH